MKRLVSLTALALLSAISLFPATAPAQPPAGNQQGQGGGRGFDPARFIDRRIEQLKTELKLTADQEKKIRAIYQEAMSAPRQQNAQQGNATQQRNGSSGAASRRDRLVAERNTNANNASGRNQIDEKIKKVLTAEQVKKFDAMPRGFGGRGGGQFDPAQMIQRRLDSMERDLTLTADQKTKIKAILEKSGNSMRQAFQPPQQGQEPDRDAMRAAMEKIRTQEAKEIEAVLKPDQVKKYRAQQAEQQQRMRERQQNGGGGNRNN